MNVVLASLLIVEINCRLVIAGDSANAAMRSRLQLLLLCFVIAGAVRDGDAVAGANGTELRQLDFTDSGTEIGTKHDGAVGIFLSICVGRCGFRCRGSIPACRGCNAVRSGCATGITGGLWRRRGVIR
jgi:hypothetical protein